MKPLSVCFIDHTNTNLVSAEAAGEAQLSFLRSHNLAALQSIQGALWVGATVTVKTATLRLPEVMSQEVLSRLRYRRRSRGSEFFKLQLHHDPLCLQTVVVSEVRRCRQSCFISSEQRVSAWRRFMFLFVVYVGQ